MLIRLLQLNLWKGAFIDKVIDFINQNHFDIIHFQEVTGTELSKQSIDCFLYFEKRLQSTHVGILAKAYVTTKGSDTYEGNATFYSNKFRVLEKRVIWLKKSPQTIEHTLFDNVDPHSLTTFFEDLPRLVLALKLQSGNNTIWSINTHLPWNQSPIDTPKKLVLTKPLLEFIPTLREPFVIMGDFNVDSRSQVVKILEQYARNLNTSFKVTNTLNQRIHKEKQLFPPGLAVDFIMPSKDLHVQNFSVIKDIDLSDHLGLIAEIEL